jgi:hypothetical protein
MTNEEIQDLDGKPVCIVTQRRVPISFGRISVSHRLEGTAGLRVELNFQTETMSCSLGLPLGRIEELKQTFNGDHYTYCITAGDAFWLAEPTTFGLTDDARAIAADKPLVATYPVAR